MELEPLITIPVHTSSDYSCLLITFAKSLNVGAFLFLFRRPGKVMTINGKSVINMASLNFLGLLGDESIEVCMDSSGAAHVIIMF